MGREQPPLPTVSGFATARYPIPHVAMLMRPKLADDAIGASSKVTTVAWLWRLITSLVMRILSRRFQPRIVSDSSFSKTSINVLRQIVALWHLVDLVIAIVTLGLTLTLNSIVTGANLVKPLSPACRPWFELLNYVLYCSACNSYYFYKFSN